MFISFSPTGRSEPLKANGGVIYFHLVKDNRNKIRPALLTNSTVLTRITSHLLAINHKES
jgi:hypothetical protein